MLVDAVVLRLSHFLNHFFYLIFLVIYLNDGFCKILISWRRVNWELNKTFWNDL